jgi:hypothetical protein
MNILVRTAPELRQQRTLPGLPFPRNQREWAKSWRLRCRLMAVYNIELPRYLATDDLDDLAGGALAVLYVNDWLSSLPQQTPLAAFPPLSLGPGDRRRWLWLLARLAVACGDWVAVMRAFNAAVRLMSALADGKYNGATLHFDEVASAVKRSIWGAAERRGFTLIDPPANVVELRLTPSQREAWLETAGVWAGVDEVTTTTTGERVGQHPLAGGGLQAGRE